MAIESSEANIQFNPEQLLQLDKYEKRMISMRMEIDTHARNLEAVRNTNAQLEKDRDNLTKGIAEKEGIITQLNQKIAELSPQVEKAQKAISEATDEQKVISDKIIAEQSDLNAKKDKLELSMAEHEKQKVELAQSIKIHELDKKELAQKKAIIAELASKLS